MPSDSKYPYIELQERGNAEESSTGYRGGTVYQPTNEGFVLRRFYMRALVGVITPIIVMLFYLYIALNYLRGPAADPDNPTNIGPGGARLVFYAWFIVGTIGINLSSYGLQGVEASMLMEKRWGANDALQLLMHCDTTWAGPGGWMKILRKWSHLIGLKHQGRANPSRLWMLLACLTAMVFIALPLSGLTMEISEGYHFKDQQRPVTTGRDYWTLNQRESDPFATTVTNFWTGGISAKLPGVGIAYTEKGVDRRKFDFLSEVPTTLPGNADENLPDLFLPSQGMTPIRGRTWGLRMRYGCSTVKDRSELTIIDQHIRAYDKAKFAKYLDNTFQETNKSFVTPNAQLQRYTSEQHDYADNSSVITQIEWDWGRAHRGFNGTSAKIPTFTQLGISDFGLNGVAMNGLPSHKQYRYHERQFTKFASLLYDKENSMEYVMYQYLGDLPTARPDLLANYHSIKGLEDIYTISNASYYWEPMKMSAIGVRCTSQSQVGFATLDAETSSFTKFTRTDSNHPAFLSLVYSEANLGIWPLSFGPLFTLTRYAAQKSISNIKLAAEAGAEKLRKEALSGSNSQKDRAVPYYPAFDQSMLKRSILSLYALYARSIMYDKAIDIDEDVFKNFFPNGSIYTSESRKNEVDKGTEGDAIEGFDSLYFHAFQNLNVTGSVPGKVLVRGILGWEVIVAVLSIWCVFSVSLVLMYGFRRRWSETLDSYSMFRFGADFGDEILQKKDFSDTKDYERCPALKEIPGLVGDSKPDTNPGKISLIWRKDHRAGFKEKRFAA